MRLRKDPLTEFLFHGKGFASFSGGALAALCCLELSARMRKNSCDTFWAR